MNERSGFALIPVGARVAAAAALVGPPALLFWLDGGGFAVAGILMGVALALTILLAGYVYGDAPRRGMPRVPWTALAVLAPNGIGFLIYFLMRNPLQPREAR
jgi:hypothetical protein